MAKILVELCCGSVAEARLAKAAGADRIEFNSALSLGGLTPSRGALRLALETGLETVVMLRPRPGDFCYGAADFETMLEDARLCREAGAGGVVFGILHPDGTVDAERCGELLRAAGGLPAVFHRAIDYCPDWRAALDTLSGLGFRRVLTSGQKDSAWEGRETLRAMRDHAAGRIGILPGGGIRGHNVRAVLEASGCGEAHFSARRPGPAASCTGAFLTEAELRNLIETARGPA